MNDEKVTFKCVIEELEKERDTLAEINKVLVEALEKLLEINIMESEHRYGDKTKAESWACVQIIRAALAKAKEMGK